MSSRSSYVTVTDQFCGAGGSSLGAVAAGAELHLALNHWKLAIETHNANFQDARHDCTDVSACDPRRYPSTDILITSPECTNHSLAKGKRRKNQGQLDLFSKPDPADERSRATMWDVPRFAEYHSYRIVVVENVVDVRHWQLYDAWLQAMSLLGYDYKELYLNSMFFWPTPQSRDRVYIVFWKKGNQAPNLNFTPLAFCPGENCGTDVHAIQAWKNQYKRWGKFGQQYTYNCPGCGRRVQPYYFCAANAIDWSLPCPRIGDRKRPLKDKTLARIRAGLQRYGHSPQIASTNYFSERSRGLSEPWPTQTTAVKNGLVVPMTRDDRVRGTEEAHPTQTGTQAHGLVITTSHGGDLERVRSTEEPLYTQAGRQDLALAIPPAFLIGTNKRGLLPRSIEESCWTQTGSLHHSLVTHPYIAEMHGRSTAAPISEALGTVCSSGAHHALVTPPPMIGTHGTEQSHLDNSAYPATEALRTVCAGGNHHYLAVPPAFLVGNYSPGWVRSVEEPTGTVTTADHHALLATPFIASYYGSSDVVHSVEEAVGTVSTRDRHALVAPPPFLVSYYGERHGTHPLGDPVPTQPTMPLHYLAHPESIAPEDCGFRMLVPREIGNAMAFPSSYKVLGNGREQVRQYGNAVTPPVMSWILRQCIETLSSRGMV